MNQKNHSGFTVLEFLIVLAIMLILIAIALPGLQTSRIKTDDEKRITDMRTIALGLEQYRQICGKYPETLNPNEGCAEIDSNQKFLKDYIPDLVKLNNSELFKYVALSYDGGNDDCIGFHIGVTLRDQNDQSIYVGDRNFDSTQSDVVICGSSTGSFDGSVAGLYDFNR